MKKTILIIVTLVCFLLPNSWAQQGKYVSAYEDGKYEKCLEMCAKAKEKDSKDLYAILYEALTWVEISKISKDDENYNSEYKNAIDKALTALSSLKKKDKTGKFIKEQNANYEKVRMALFAKGDEYAIEGNEEKVRTFYEKILNSLDDPRDYFYLGRSYLLCGQDQYGVEYINRGLSEYYALYRRKGIKPDSVFFNDIISLTDILSDGGHNRHAFQSYILINLMFPDDGKKISNHHLYSLLTPFSDLQWTVFPTKKRTWKRSTSLL